MFPEPRRPHGITLIELAVGLVVLGILGSLALPSFRSQIAAARLTSTTNDLMASMMQARSQAIRLGGRVVVCRTANQSSCDTNATHGWDTGWLVFLDADQDGTVSTGDTVIARSPARPGLVIQGNSQLASAAFFRASGASGVTGTLQVCSPGDSLPDARRARQLVVTGPGRVVLQRQASTSDCPVP